VPHSSAAFTLTSIQKDTLELLNGLQGLGDRLLIIQPCATGKSRYYLHFADQPKTLVVLAQPFVSLQQQTTADLLKEHCVTKVNDNSFLSAQTVQKGILLLCSYERLHSMVNVAKQAIQEGLKLVVCIDEVHVLLDSVTVQSGYRAFRSVWTFMASLLQFNYIFFAMSATVRPKHEALLAQELGLNAFSKIHRTSPRRPEVTLLKIVCQTKQAALMSLVDQNPQMILVMTKSAGAQLQDELKQRGVTSQFFHAGMGTAEKGEILSVLGIKCVIATTAFITGLNAFQLHNSVIWQFAYSFESVTQFMGRLARKRGTVGTCTFITYPQAIQAYQKGRIAQCEFIMRCGFFNLTLQETLLQRKCQMRCRVAWC
jgi:superfamily II DNA helicase RecQ